jgi:hypothetical protein
MIVSMPQSTAIRCGACPGGSWGSGCSVDRRFEILAVTNDDRFFSSLAYMGAELDSSVKWTRSLDRALQILDCGGLRLVVYDWYPIGRDWQSGIQRLTSDGRDPCVILAAPEVSEDLWRRAMACGAYDIALRTGRREQLRSTLQFAQKWERERRTRWKEDCPDRSRERTGDIVVYARHES